PRRRLARRERRRGSGKRQRREPPRRRGRLPSARRARRPPSANLPRRRSQRRERLPSANPRKRRARPRRSKLPQAKRPSAGLRWTSKTGDARVSPVLFDQGRIPAILGPPEGGAWALLLCVVVLAGATFFLALVLIA